MSTKKRDLKWAAAWLALVALTLLVWNPLRALRDRDTALQAGPPWTYGKPTARFTVTLYADLECPYCQGYLPQLQRWIDATPEVNLQWHHLPLPQHEPAASTQARLAECVGEEHGGEGFWQAVHWIYRHTQGNGRGVPADLKYPDASASLQACINSPQAEAVVHAQKVEAASAGLIATPSLRLADNRTQRQLQLQGPIEPDALLSALDLLADPEPSDVPADPVSDMPR